MAEADGRGRVTRRRVFFVSGFDPNGPRRYHALYRAEAARQGGIDGNPIEVGPLRLSPGAARWSVSREGGEAAFEMLRWDDIARSRMRRPLPALYLLMARTFAAYVFTGAFFRLSRLRLVSTLVGLYPPLMMLLYLAGACLAGALVHGAAAGLGAPLWLSAPSAAATAWGVMRLSKRADGATLVYYLMADLGFTADHAAGRAPEMEARIDAFAHRIGEAMAEDWDEVLLVGHSSGAAYAASAAARALSAARPGAALSLLTLGQTIPMLSFLPGAKRLRAELAALAAEPRLDWVDVSSPADGGCYALSDAAAVSGGPPGRNPKVISARFADGLAPETRRALRGRWFRKHIQYLCAFERPAGFDYFAVTAGPERLGPRFAGRRDSPRADRRNRFGAG